MTQREPEGLPNVGAELDAILQFLYGADQLDGRWFGDVVEKGPRFWWRSRLRAAFAADRRSAFLAGRIRGLEEGAVVADRLTTALDHGGNEYRREGTASQVATAIRSLKEKPNAGQ